MLERKGLWRGYSSCKCVNVAASTGQTKNDSYQHCEGMLILLLYDTSLHSHYYSSTRIIIYGLLHLVIVSVKNKLHSSYVI